MASRLSGSPSATASAKGGQKAKCKAKGKAKSCKKPKRPLLVPASVNAAAAGPVSITVALSGPAKAQLAKKGRLTVPVQLTFTPVGGVASTQVKKVTFKKRGGAKKCKGAKCKGSGKRK